MIKTAANVAAASAIISNDDPPPAYFDFSSETYSVNEGDSGTSTITVTVNRSGNTAGAVSVDLLLEDGNAIPDVDFVDIPTTTLNFADGITTQTFDVTIIGDTIYEGDEGFALELDNPVGGSTGTVWLTTISIIDDDPNLDVNGDGFITPTDAVYVVNRIGSTDLSADVDGDNDVDQADVDAVLAALGTTVP